MDDFEVRELIDALLIAAGDSTAPELAAALHEIVVSQHDVCAEFNRHVERNSRRLKPAPLHKLMTKRNFGTN